MTSIFERLGYNFDTTKFDGAEKLSAGAIKYLDDLPNTLSPWQANDIGNSTATTEEYFQNPHSSNLVSIKTTLDGMMTTIDSTSYTDPTANTDALALKEIANTTIYILQDFFNHTNNMSGVSNSAASSDASNTTLPDLNSAISVGRQILEITNKSDGVQNSVPILGNFTSLYIGSDIANSNTILATDLPLLSDVNITSASVLNITLHVNQFQNLISTRMTSDLNFYANSLSVISDYSRVVSLQTGGATQNSLLKIIGTDKLKKDIGLT